MTTHRQSAAAAVLMLLAGTATAQNALGDGRGLDNSLSTQGRFNQARPSLDAEIAFRNAIATGNAGNGASFRGDVGYTAPSAFRGELGSNDLFAFRRDSLTSGLAGMGIRGTDALQLQMSLATGARPPSNLIGSFVVDPSGAGTTASQVARRDEAAGLPGRIPGQPLPTAILRSDADPDADPRGTALWSLRSPSSYLTTRGLQPVLLDVTESQGERVGLTASTLRGVRLSPLADLTAPIDPAQALAPGQRPGQPGATPGSPAPGQAGADDAEPRPQTMHQRVLEEFAAALEANRVAAQEAAAQAATPAVAPTNPLDQLQIWLRTGQGENPFAPPALDPATDPATDPAGVTEPEADPAASTTAPGAERGTMSSESLRLLETLRSQRAELIGPSRQARDPFTAQMVEGQNLLAQGRFFDAEERFAGALAVEAGDITAQIGRLHAQLGAGLFASAAVNLRDVLDLRPELAAVRYAPSLLPTPARIDALRVRLRSLASPESTAGGSMPHDAALLLAYLSSQTGDTETVAWALRRFEATILDDGTDPARAGIERRLARLLRSLWLERSAPDAGAAPPGAGTGALDG